MSTFFTPSSQFSPEMRVPLVPGDLLDQLVHTIEQLTMMQFGTERRELLISTVVSIANESGDGDVCGYIRRIMQPSSKAEMNSLIDALTINETTFFRNVPQLKMFSTVALPEIMSRKRAANAPRRLRIWSAGCSTGQEAYTLAMLANDLLLMQPGWDLQIHATDISPTVLEMAQRGVYPKARLDTMPDTIRLRYLDDLGDRIQIKDSLRRSVTFRYHNLRDPFPIETYDVIFCRNVMIYFSREEQARLAQRFKDRLDAQGFLFIGHSESLQGLNVGLQLRMHEGGVAYQKV